MASSMVVPIIHGADTRSKACSLAVLVDLRTRIREKTKSIDGA